MNIFEFSEMVGQDIVITYRHKSGTFKATIPDVLSEVDGPYVRGEGTDLTGALLNLCENLSCTSVTVLKDDGAFTLKTPAIVMRDDWRKGK